MIPDPENRIARSEGIARLAIENDWTPVRLYSGENSEKDVVTWAKIGHGPFHQAGFDQDLRDRMDDAPWFLSESSWLHAYARDQRGVEFRGMIWHMSRCGSTVARNLLAATDHSVVIAEPSLINEIMLAIQENPDGPGAGYLRSALQCFARPDGNRLTRAYLKCTSWNVLLADEMHAQATSVPCVFIHSDPVLVLASLHKAKPGWASPDFFLFDAYGIDPAGNTLERMAEILARFLESALRAEARGYCRFVPYSEILSRFVDGDIPRYFGYEVTPSVREKMISIAMLYSKGAGEYFQPDEASRREYARSIPGLEDLAERWTGDLYREILARSTIKEP